MSARCLFQRGSGISVYFRLCRWRLHESSDGQQILYMMQVNRLLVWEDRFLEPVTRLLAKHRLVIGGDEAPTTENSIATHDELPTVAPVEAAENKPANSSVEENGQP